MPFPRRLGLVAPVLVAAAALSACNASADKTSGSSGDAAADATSLILVTPEPVGVNPFLQLAVTGVEKAAQDAGGTSRTFQSQDATTVQQQLAAAVAAKPDVVAVVGFEFAASLAAPAQANPDQHFLFVDAGTAE